MSDYDVATLLSTREVAKTRKSHQCFGCLRRFPKRSRLTCENFAYDGKAYSLYYCEPCKSHLKNIPHDIDVQWGDIGFWEGDQWYPRDEYL